MTVQGSQSRRCRRAISNVHTSSTSDVAIEAFSLLLEHTNLEYVVRYFSKSPRLDSFRSSTIKQMREEYAALNYPNAAQHQART